MEEWEDDEDDVDAEVAEAIDIDDDDEEVEMCDEIMIGELETLMSLSSFEREWPKTCGEVVVDGGREDEGDKSDWGADVLDSGESGALRCTSCVFIDCGVE